MLCCLLPGLTVIRFTLYYFRKSDEGVGGGSHDNNETNLLD